MIWGGGVNVGVCGEFRLFLYVHVPHMSLRRKIRKGLSFVVLEDPAQSENVSLKQFEISWLPLLL